MTSQRIVIVTAAAEDLELFQIDIKNAYLNREIDTDIYMKQLVGFKDLPTLTWCGHSRKVSTASSKRIISGMQLSTDTFSSSALSAH
jgi:hypothetical protein